MQENSRYAVGIDVGTTTVRCVVGHIDTATGVPTIVGVGKAPNTGMRKGTVVHLQGPATAIDDALGEAERMSGYQVNAAALSINGAHLLSTKADGMIAVGSLDHEITQEDLHRIEEVATIGKVPANREILDVVPHSYRLDGQDGIKDPLGMTGTRLEINANVISTLSPHLHNLEKTAKMANVEAHPISPSVIAASHAVLKEAQIENGVAVIDFGGATTSVAVFEEGDLQHVGVIPIGGNNITNDLAIGLKTDPEIAEQVKVLHADVSPRKDIGGVSIKHDGNVHTFQLKDVDEIVEARLEEIFEDVQKELKKAGRAGQLPAGVVIVGGSSHIKHLAEYAKEALGLAAQIGKPMGFGGVSEQAEKPEFAAAVGLMFMDSERDALRGDAKKMKKVSGASAGATIDKVRSFARRLLGKFKI
ncbi:MAG: cell division protein FtsA [Candidatus Saccharimonadales bacterium]